MVAWMTAALLTGAVCVLINVYVWLKNRRIWEMGKKIPGPKVENFLLGHTTLISDPKTCLTIAKDLFEKHGPVVRLWIGPYLAVILKDPDDMQAVLGDKDVRNRTQILMRAVNMVQGPGLVILRDDEWKTTRKVLTPTFHVKVLETFIDEFGINARILTDRLKAYASGDSVDVFQQLMFSMMETAGNTIMGSSERATFSSMSDFTTGLSNSNLLLYHLATHPWYMLLPCLYQLTSQGKRVEQFKQSSKAFSAWVISRKLSDYAKGVPSKGVTTSGDRVLLTFVDAMLQSTKNGKPTFTQKDIEDEVGNMLAAATATTSLALAYTLMLVALHPQIQAEIQKEQNDIFGSETRYATLEDIQKMDLLDRCIMESLRLFPVSAINPRDVPKDIQLPSGYILPAGCNVLHLAILTHRDPRYFPEPEEFRPDRWLPENRKNIHPFSYLPYSAGPRDCIGKKYAQLQMKSFLSQIFRELVIHPVHDMKTMQDNLLVSMASTINDETGYLIRVTSR